jgi:hypothetical protein
MSWTYEITLRGAPGRRADLQAWLETGARATLAAVPGLARLDLYTPADGAASDRYNDDSVGPLMMLMLDFASCGALTAAVTAGGIAAAADTLAPDIAAAGTAFECRFFPVGNDREPAPLVAPFSYVVRYHRPADDETAFVANYLGTHPTIQTRLPGIRNIMCYLPLDHVHGRNPARLRSAGYMIGNEVVFDDVGAFNTAMVSPVRQELRAHYHAFPRFTGANTHYPMVRRRLEG